jgi:hypothetical protein
MREKYNIKKILHRTYRISVRTVEQFHQYRIGKALERRGVY